VLVVVRQHCGVTDRGGVGTVLIEQGFHVVSFQENVPCSLRARCRFMPRV
jgi:hypothetical protein